MHKLHFPHKVIGITKKKMIQIRQPQGTTLQAFCVKDANIAAHLRPHWGNRHDRSKCIN